MSVSRRSFLAGTGLIGLSGLAGLTGCGADQARATKESLSFWYWSGALSDAVVASVVAQFAPQAAITPTVVPGDFKQRLATALSSKVSVPDITGIKGEDLPTFLTRADSFLDLNTLGARGIASSFAAAKYRQGATADGRQVGLPIDLGPIAVFVRADLWAKAGLPAEPAAMSKLTRTWDGWFTAARRLRKALPGTFSIRNSSDVFGCALAQEPETFITRDGRFAGDGGAVRRAWDLAVRSVVDGVQASIYDGAAFNSALASGTLGTQIGPAWNGLDIEAGAPNSSGAWRVAECPGGPANIGGSFLALPVGCRAPQVAFDVVASLLSPANQARSFTDAAVFPAATAAYALPALTRGQPFYGGQATIEVFGPAAKNLPVVYDAPLNAAVSATYVAELANVEGGKDPARAWKDAVAAGREAASQPTG